MPYIKFTDEQIYRANSVNLEHFLQMQGEKLIPSGRDKRLASDNSVTVRGNAWYDHASEEGGLAIDFVQQHYGLTFPDAVVRLLNGETGMVYEPEYKPKEQKLFVLPPAHTDMRRVYAYLLDGRLLGRDIVSHFVREKLIYESHERLKNKEGVWKEYRNAVFVGLDENGAPRHAHKRGPYTNGGYRGNVEGSDAAYSFHHAGKSSRLYVFEAPIDLLSFLTLYPKDWQRHSYVALCGTSEHAVLKMLELHPHLQEVALCLDHDEAGIEATGRLTEILAEKGHTQVAALLPTHKDWNEDIKARHGQSALSAEEHPQLVVCPAICDRIAMHSVELPKASDPEKRLPSLLESCRSHIHRGRLEQALNCIGDAAALSLFAAAREYRQMGNEKTAEELSSMLRDQFCPHQNRGKIHTRTAELSMKLQAALSLYQVEGLRTPEQKQKQADVYVSLALDCAKILIKHQADELKQEMKAQTQSQMLMAQS